MQLPDAAIERLLDTWPVARLATVGAGGRPHQVPIVFARAAGRLWSAIDAKPKGAGEPARVRNVRAHPEVSLLLDHYDADWRRLWWLRIDGTAAVVQPPPGERDAGVAAGVAALRAKYPQYAAIPLLGEPPTLLAIEPSARRSWAFSRAALDALLD